MKTAREAWTAAEIVRALAKANPKQSVATLIRRAQDRVEAQEQQSPSLASRGAVGTTSTQGSNMSPTLLDLAREFDATPRADIFARITDGKELTTEQQATFDKLMSLSQQIETAVGDKRDEFRERYDALIAAKPKFPWPAEFTLRLFADPPPHPGREIIQYVETDEDIFSLFDCGCAYAMLTPLFECAADCATHKAQSDGMTWHQVAIAAHGRLDATQQDQASSYPDLVALMAERFARQDSEKRRAEIVSVASRLLVGDMVRPPYVTNLNNCDMGKYISAAVRLIEAAEKVVPRSQTKAEQA